MNTLNFLKQILIAGPAIAMASSGAANAQGVAVAQPAFETTGSYKVVMEMSPSLPHHTIYRPENLATVKGKLPVVAFGNGACANAGDAFGNYLAEVASHGFVVVANGPIDPNAPGRPPKGTPPPMPVTGAGLPSGFHFDQSKTSDLFETMDWVKTQGEQPGSPFYGALDPNAIAVMGQSCGGLQALEAASDPRVKTAVILNSGIIRGPTELPAGMPRPPEVPAGAPPGAPPAAFPALPGSVESLKKLHTPIIYIIGGPTDIAYKNAESDFADINGVPLFEANLAEVGHGGTYWQPHGGKFAEVATQWLLWQLKGDTQAGASFLGKDCGLCHQPEWSIKRKDMN